MFWNTIKSLRERNADLTEELDEADNLADQYRRNWIEERSKVEDLKSKLDSIERTLTVVENKNTHLMTMYLDMSKQVMTVKPENVILRQILEDLTGKSADDLIEAHKRAVRKLEYGVEIPTLPEDKEEK